MNNSWGSGSSGGDGYVAECREVNLAVRDADANTPALQSLAVVFSAGNTGGRAQSSFSRTNARTRLWSAAH